MEPEARRNAERKGRGVFTFGNLLSLFVGLPVTIIGLIIGLIWGWFLLLWIGLAALAIGISCSFFGLIVGAGVAKMDVEEAVVKVTEKAKRPMTGTQDITFLKDDDWSAIDGEICRVLEFTPMSAAVRNGQVEASDHSTPYASVVFECRKIRGKATGFITHKVDFAMLWAAFNERTQVKGARVEVQYDANGGGPAFVENSKLAKHGVAPNEEVWLVWTKKRYKSWAGMMDKFLPRLLVMVCPKGAYELANYPEVMPELGGEARFLAERPLVTWTPEAMVE